MPKRSQKAKKPTAWELAKPILTQEILDGDIPEGIHPDIIRERKTIYKSVPRSNFYSNMKALQKRINIDKARAVRDKAALDHDKIVQRNRNVVPLASKKPKWDGSQSQSHLKSLMLQNEHIGKQPREVFYSNQNAIFQEEGFTLTDIRKHIQQEISSTRVSGYWLAKKRRNKNTAPASAGAQTPSQYNIEEKEGEEEDDVEGENDDEIE